VERHDGSSDWWLNFTLAINEEESLDTKLKVLGVNRRLSGK